MIHCPLAVVVARTQSTWLTAHGISCPDILAVAVDVHAVICYVHTAFDLVLTVITFVQGLHWSRSQLIVSTFCGTHCVVSVTKLALVELRSGQV